MADIRLVLAGPIDEGFHEELKSMPAYSVVDYRGVCSREEVKAIYEEAFIGTSTIQPVLQYPLLENLPTKVYEYMMNAMPYVISDFDYSKSVVSKYNCGIAVDTTKPTEIAKAISYLASHKTEAIEMGRNGRMAVLKELNWENEEKKLYRVYENLHSK